MKRHPGPGCHGFTAVELMIVIAILAISLSLAIPSFTELRLNALARQQQMQWLGFLSAARAAAVKQQTWVTVCPAVNDQCTTDLNTTWYAFYDQERSLSIQDQSQIVSMLTIPEPTRLLMYKGNTTLPYFRYRAMGTSGNLRSLTVCPDGIANERAFHLTSTHLGHIRFLEDTTGDGIVDRLHKGKRVNVHCP